MSKFVPNARKPRQCNSEIQWVRWRAERYAILRDVAGLGSDEARPISASPVRFAEALRSRGIDPEQWSLLSHKQQSGHERKHTEWHELSRARYHELKALGANSREASESCKGEGSFEYMKRKLALRKAGPNVSTKTAASG